MEVDRQFKIEHLQADQAEGEQRAEHVLLVDRMTQRGGVERRRRAGARSPRARGGHVPAGPYRSRRPSPAHPGGLKHACSTLGARRRVHNAPMDFKPLITLLAIVNPLACVPFFIHYTQGFTREQRQRTVLVSSFSAFAVIAASALLGLQILEFFGISLASFQVGGGMLLLTSALSMLNAQPAEARANADEVQNAEARAAVGASIAVVPLTIPLLTGPATMSTVVIYAEKAKNFAQLGTLVGYGVVIALATALCFSLAMPIARILGKTGINVMTRLMGLILAALAVVIGGWLAGLLRAPDGPKRLRLGMGLFAFFCGLLGLALIVVVLRPALVRVPGIIMLVPGIHAVEVLRPGLAPAVVALSIALVLVMLPALIPVGLVTLLGSSVAVTSTGAGQTPTFTATVSPSVTGGPTPTGFEMPRQNSTCAPPRSAVRRPPGLPASARRWSATSTPRCW